MKIYSFLTLTKFKWAEEDNQLVRPRPKWDISCHNHLKSVSICHKGGLSISLAG